MRRALALCLSLWLVVGPASSQTRVQPPEIVRGSLTDSDPRTVRGVPYDEYRIEKRDDRIRLTVHFLSSEFSPRIEIRGPNNRYLDEEDIRHIRPDEFSAFLERNGVYHIFVTGASRDARGRYVARITLEGPEGPPPSPPVLRLDSVPMASRATSITAACLQNRSRTYGQIYDRLDQSLTARGYPTVWYLTPSGFAIMTSFERITDSGVTIAQDRFSTAPFRNTLLQVMTHQTTPGRYRSFIIAYGTGLQQQATPVGMPRIEAMAESRGFSLPQAVRAQLGGPDHYLQIFVYEYYRPSINAPATWVRSGLQVEDHLSGSRLGPALRAICGA